MQAAFLGLIGPTVRDLAKGGVRKPLQVARVLNRLNVTTASGAKWDYRLARLLLSYLFSEAEPKRVSREKVYVPADPTLTAPAKKASVLAPGRSAPNAKTLAEKLGSLGRIKKAR